MAGYATGGDRQPPWMNADEFEAARGDPYRAFDIAQQRILDLQQRVALRHKTNQALQADPKYAYARTSQNLEKLKAEHSTLHAAYEELEKTQGSLNEVVDVLRGDKREMLVQMNTAKRDLMVQRLETEQLEVEAEKKRAHDRFIDEKIKGQEQQVAQLDDNEKASRKKIAELQAEVNSLEAACQSLALQTKSLTDLREHLEGTHRAQAGSIKSLEREVQEKEKQVVEQSRQLWEFKRDMSTRILALQKTAQERQDELDQLRRLSEHEIDTLAAQNKALNDELKKTSDALFKARKEKTDFSSAARKEISEKTEDTKRYTAILELVGKQNDGLEAAVKRLEDQNRLSKRQIAEKDNVNHKNLIEQANFISLVHMELQSTLEDVDVLKARICHGCRNATSTESDDDENNYDGPENNDSAMRQLTHPPSYPLTVNGKETEPKTRAESAAANALARIDNGADKSQDELNRMREALDALNRQLLEERAAREREREVDQKLMDEQAYDRERRKAEEAERQRRSEEDERKRKAGEHAYTYTVLLADGSRRRIDGFASDTVRELIGRLCLKLGIRQRESLHVAHVVNENSVSGPVDRYLDKAKTLEAEGITPTTALALKFKHIKRQREWQDSVAQEWFFRQLHQNVVGEYTPVSEATAVKLASFELQAVFGDYSAQKRNKYFERVGLDSYLPSSVSAHEYEYWQERLSLAHKQHNGINATQSRDGYVQLLATTPFWGVTFFDVRDRDNRPFLAGISEDGLNVFSANKKELLSVVTFADLVGWERAPNGVYIKRRGSSKMTLYATSKLQSKEMVDLLNEYYLLLPQNIRDTLQIPIVNEDNIRAKLPSPASFEYPVTNRPAPIPYNSRLEYLKAAYMATCLEADEQGRQHQPITKFTHAIDVAIDSGTSLETLDLSACEPPLDDYQYAIISDLFHYTLEEYQPPVHSTAIWREDIALKSISLAQEPAKQLLTTSTVERIPRFLAKFPQIVHMNLSYINVENIAKNLGDVLSSLPELEELILKGCRIGAQTLQPLLLVFGPQPSKLHTLDLENNFLTHAAIHPLTEIMKSGKTALASLNLAYNRLDPTGIDLLVFVMKSTQSIRSLDISGNPGIFAQSTRIGDLFASNTSLRELTLRSCDIQGASRRAMATELPSNSRLRSLVLSQNPLGVDWPRESDTDMSPEEQIFFFLTTTPNVNAANGDQATVQSNAQSSQAALRILEMEQCMLGDAAGSALARALTQNNTVHKLLLAKNDLARASGFFPPVWESMLSANMTLRELDLSDNGLSYAGAMKLFAILLRNRSITTLKLNYNNLTSASTPKASSSGSGNVAHEEIISFLERNQSLTELSLVGCNIKDDLLIAIGEGLRRNRTLRTLLASSNDITVKGIIELARLLTSNTGLTTLDLTCDSVRTDENLYIESYKLLAEAGTLDTISL